MPRTLFIVYNANSGLFNGAMDSVHKLISPASYACQLCSITHGYFGAKESWKNFIAQLKQNGVNIRVLYKDDLKNWPLQFSQIPGVYTLNHGELNLLVGSDQLRNMNKSEDLIEFLRAQLNLINDSVYKNSALRTH